MSIVLILWSCFCVAAATLAGVVIGYRFGSYMEHDGYLRGLKDGYERAKDNLLRKGADK